MQYNVKALDLLPNNASVLFCTQTPQNDYDSCFITASSYGGNDPETKLPIFQF